ncbi:anti-sigma factor domain-containing protein [Epilithonimonas sp.]|uniref:anti-sigma factor n=1 Tax=Epilithonimonas sp. TaxID=2894511 RepID=UPI0035B219F6
MNTKQYISSGIIESYILGLASPEEAGILECIMKNNAEVKAAFDEAQKTLEDLADAQAIKPPADLKTKIWNRIQNEPQQHIESIVSSEIPLENPQEEIRVIGNNNWKVFAAAASVLFLLSLAGNLFWLNNQSENKERIIALQSEKKNLNSANQKISQKLKMFSDPDMVMVALKGVEKHPESKAVVFWDKKTKNVYLNAEDLPKAPEGMQYQLWAIADGKPVSAGMYTEEKDSKVSLANIPKAQAFAITLEKQGGSTVPTMENMFVIGNI